MMLNLRVYVAEMVLFVTLRYLAMTEKTVAVFVCQTDMSFWGT